MKVPQHQHHHVDGQHPHLESESVVREVFRLALLRQRDAFVRHWPRVLRPLQECNIRGIWVLIHANWVADLLLPPTLPPHV